MMVEMMRVGPSVVVVILTLHHHGSSSPLPPHHITPPPFPPCGQVMEMVASEAAALATKAATALDVATVDYLPAPPKGSGDDLAEVS